ncbi:MAG: BatD family protein [Bacteroidales bacterium]
MRLILKNIFVSLILIFALTDIQGQDVNFTITAPNSVTLGQQFQVTYTIDQNVDNFSSPSFSDFNLLQGPYQQSRSSTSIINGKVSTTKSYSYTFVLSAKKEGRFTLPKAIAVVKGNTYYSEQAEVNVLSGGGSSGSQGNVGSSSQQQGRASSTDAADNIFIKTVVSNSNPYIGEPIELVYKLYTPTAQLQIGHSEKEPTFQGFWVEDLLKDATQYTQYNETVNGKRYIVVELRKYSLIPQKAGSFNTPVINNQVVYQTEVKADSRRSNDPFGNDPFFQFFDNSFFRTRYQTVNKQIASNSIKINVKPLPTKNKPIDFSGAVGQMDIKADISKTTANTNEAITYTISVTGRGNVKLIEIPKPNFPPDFEVYEPKITENYSNKNKTSGTKRHEYLIIPRTAGDFTIPETELNFYNTLTKSYQTTSTKPISIKILKGSGTHASESNEIKIIDTDIRHIVEGKLNLKGINKNLFNSSGYWIVFALCILVFIALILVYSKNKKLRSNTTLLLQRKATKVARKRLKKAKHFLDLNNKTAFHEELSNALWLYISHKFNVPIADLSLENTKEVLQKLDVDAITIDKFLKVLNDCNFAQYAPQNEAVDMPDLYNNAMQVITETEAELK